MNPPTTRRSLTNRALRAEWTKVSTLPAARRTIAAGIVTSTALGTLVVAAQVSRWDAMTPAQHAAFDPTGASLIGLLIAAVILGALAVRSISDEYATGMIAATMTALPRRSLVVAAKAAIMAAIALPVTLLGNIIGLEIGQRILAAKHLHVTLGDPGVARAIVAGALAASLICVIGVGLGGLLRRTSTATATLSLVLVGGATFGQAIPAAVRQYLPSAATQATVTVHRSPGLLRPITALAVLGAYAAVALCSGVIRVSRSDL